MSGYNQVGWIYPDGILKTVPLYCHYKSLFEDQHALSFIDFATYDELYAWAQERYEDELHYFQEQMDPDEHPCWHCFDCSTEDFIQDEIFSAGFIRYGAYINKFDEIELETASHNEPKEEFINKLMDETGATLANCRPYAGGKIYRKYKR